MGRPGFVLDVDERTPPLLMHEGEGFRLERLPLGSRVIYPPESLPGIVDTIGRAMTLASWHREDPARALARAVITPELGDIGMFDFRRLDELVERGRAAGRAALGDL